MSDFLFCYNFKFYYLPFALSHSLIRKSHNDNFPSHTPSRSLIDMLRKKSFSASFEKQPFKYIKKTFFAAIFIPIEVICERSIKCRDFWNLLDTSKLSLLNSTLYNLRKLNYIIVNKHVNIRKLHNQELHYIISCKICFIVSTQDQLLKRFKLKMIVSSVKENV